jgi:hypothetical protein
MKKKKMAHAIIHVYDINDMSDSAKLAMCRWMMKVAKELSGGTGNYASTYSATYYKPMAIKKKG